jgi:hypothetical protein
MPSRVESHIMSMKTKFDNPHKCSRFSTISMVYGRQLDAVSIELAVMVEISHKECR